MVDPRLTPSSRAVVVPDLATLDANPTTRPHHAAGARRGGQRESLAGVETRPVFNAVRDDMAAPRPHSPVSSSSLDTPDTSASFNAAHCVVVK
jgi:hypothetical protein